MAAVPTVHRLARRAVSSAVTLSPRLGAAAALPLFMHCGPRRRVRPEEQFTHAAATRSLLPVPGLRGHGGASALGYRWGQGPETVLLVHGWAGRASQFAALVRELQAAGYAVVAFDAPGHGDAPGRGTYILDFLAAMKELERRHGPFRAVVGHSFGALAGLIAVSEGLAAERVVSISGAADSDYLVSSFGAALRLGRPAVDALRERFHRRILPREADPFTRFSAVLNPLPEDTPLLLVHDLSDTQVAPSESQRLLDANRGHARLVTTQGLGHNRLLAADPVLDAVNEFVGAGDYSSAVASTSLRPA